MEPEQTAIEKRIARDKAILLECLEATGNIKVGCRKAGIARSSYYRYRRFDKDFSRKADAATVEGMLQMRDIKEKIQNQTEEDRDPNKEKIFEEFIEWYVMLPQERDQLGLTSQKEFADYHKINKDTIPRWKKRKDFIERDEAYRREWRFDRTDLVVASILKAAIRGNTASQRYWMEWLSGWNIEKPQKDAKTSQVLAFDDIRFVIDGFPEGIRKKHYDALADMIYDSVLQKDRPNEIEANFSKNRPEHGGL